MKNKISLCLTLIPFILFFLYLGIKEYNFSGSFIYTYGNKSPLFFFVMSGFFLIILIFAVFPYKNTYPEKSDSQTASCNFILHPIENKKGDYILFLTIYNIGESIIIKQMMIDEEINFYLNPDISLELPPLNLEGIKMFVKREDLEKAQNVILTFKKNLTINY
ncbi:MAG TPA: hypothetical protein PKY81_03495 [bacterium]|nr:hypothetical protein [bacterium]HPN30000.1 hypothetical protein [bacterium]